MKLLIINERGLYGGGAENRISLLAKELIRTKTFEEICFISKSKVTMPGITGYEAIEKTIYQKTKEVIAKHAIDIIQIHNAFDFACQAIKSAKEMDKPVIFFAHDYWGFCGRRILLNRKNQVCNRARFVKCSNCIGWLSFLHMLRIKKELNKCNIAITPSMFVKNIYERNNLLKGKWKIIPPWIDLNLFKQNKKIKRDKKTILFVGPLTYTKGADTLAKAMKFIVQKIPEVRLKFIGCNLNKDDQDLKRIQAILKQDNTLQNVEFSEPKYGKELAEEYQKAGVYVCCPVWPEVFGQTWAQAMACGCPVIATKVGSIPELAGSQISLITNQQEVVKEILRLLCKLQKSVCYEPKFNIKKVIPLLQQTYVSLKYNGPI